MSLDKKKRPLGSDSDDESSTDEIIRSGPKDNLNDLDTPIPKKRLTR